MDNIIVTDAIKDNEGQGMVVAPILEECMTLLQDFGKVSIEHCNRESNAVAHELARWGSVNNPSVWVDAPPNFIINLLVDDVAVIDK